MKKKIIKTKSFNYQKKSVDISRRIYVLSAFIFLTGFAIFAKLYFLQIISYDSFLSMADNQHKKRTNLEAKRGEIFLQDDASLYPIAVNKEMKMVYAVPKEIKDIDMTVENISQILNIEKEEIKKRLDKPEDMFEILKRKLSDEEVQKIKEIKLSGIYLQGENFRFYPAGELGAQLVGFVGSDGEKQKGMYGIESFWNEKLKGEEGFLEQEGDSRGRWISVGERNIKPSKNGSDIILTINHTVQFEVEKILKETMNSFAADGASAVVMEPKTGKILALANAPTFNPNNFSKTEDISTFSNNAISQQYESGSVFKAFTEAIGIDDGKINANTTYVDTGIVKEAGYEIRNSDLKANGVQTMTQVLEKSLNTGVIFIEKLVGNKRFFEYIKKFGFGEKTEIDLPGELTGNIKNLNNINSDINFFTASFGQGISVTPIQLALGYSVLANGGVLMKPQIIEKFINSDGQEEVVLPQEKRQVISNNSSEEIRKILRSVIVNGHGKRADVPGYLVCGKTGTAQIAKKGGGGYEEGTNIGSFAGFAPMNDPKFVVVVKIINPRGVEWAESSAAPTFGQIMKFLLEYYKVKPTEDYSLSPLAKMPEQKWPIFIPGVSKIEELKNNNEEKNDKQK